MLNSKKRPTAPTAGKTSSKPFNPAHTHPASISSPTSIQTKEHVTDAKSGASARPAVPEEGIQSGGGGGGGVGAGSDEGIEGLGIDKQGDKGKVDDKWSDPKKVHPAWDGFGKGPQAGKADKDEETKAKL
ncbi:hypothetical protein IAU60_002901 [Kwoniella sp. DSM 27419]